ncbi:hypothetical protein QTI99_14310 [Clostridium perfringens]|uniref:hypothetical protein n=1 Tax=Clostridium perfringens TaxID=1502 RepID=UPI002ED52BC2|nr:hypothetical protein [Clostridium perfringens]WVM77487.1 hypothetical protein V1680_15725 [Clostridium perfringens]
MIKKVCDCPYYKSCGEIRQTIQVEYREENKKGLDSCPFYPYLKDMYESLKRIDLASALESGQEVYKTYVREGVDNGTEM